jgi:hypothetical protein
MLKISLGEKLLFNSTNINKTNNNVSPKKGLNSGGQKFHIKNVIQLEISKNENSRKIREIILTKREIKNN